MKCPKCWNAVLRTQKVKGIEIQVCPECQGILFDRDELDAVLKAHVGDEVEKLPVVRKSTGMDKAPAYCFKCEQDMEVTTEPWGIRVDVCPSCQAAFLDFGELTFLRREYESKK